MIKTMIAKYPGRDARTGAPIRPGDDIQFDTVTRRAWITAEPGAIGLRADDGRYISDVFRTSGGTFYRNKAGRCEDAPCCGCCTI